MNAWLIAAGVLMSAGLGPCAWLVLRGAAHARLAGVSLATTLVAVVLLLLAEGFGRTSYGDLALVLAVLGPVGTLVFTRFLAGEPHEGGGAAT
ncbi:monovalent cation/H+ antiporter complex subunit F [Streptomyces sp. PA03-1a]|nr:monovalent cation/H+ antiporter complex subunit F [Streptomyces sp. PA03-1a]MDX2814044.1 monovalent cation/H+ antiporter complex subunit F [Streptomyces sp. PA03-5A]